MKTTLITLLGLSITLLVSISAFIWTQGSFQSVLFSMAFIGLYIGFLYLHKLDQDNTLANRLSDIETKLNKLEIILSRKGY